MPFEAARTARRACSPPQAALAETAGRAGARSCRGTRTRAPTRDRACSTPGPRATRYVAGDPRGRRAADLGRDRRGAAGRLRTTRSTSRPAATSLGGARGRGRPRRTGRACTGRCSTTSARPGWRSSAPDGVAARTRRSARSPRWPARPSPRRPLLAALNALGRLRPRRAESAQLEAARAVASVDPLVDDPGQPARGRRPTARRTRRSWSSTCTRRSACRTGATRRSRSACCIRSARSVYDELRAVDDISLRRSRAASSSASSAATAPARARC